MTAKRAVVIGVTADQHVNSTVGLAPPEGYRHADGQKTAASRVQKWLWGLWCDFHAQLDAQRKADNADLYYVLNGDCVDGDHHGTLQIMTRDLDGQHYLAMRVFGVVAALKPQKLYVVRGTKVHTGTAEESLARDLGADLDPEYKNASCHILRLQVHGKLLDFRHHASIGGLPWTVPGGVARLAFRHWVECMDKNERPGDLVIRSHKHTFADSGSAHKTRAIITPAWQLKTEFAHQVVTENLADVGGLIIRISTGGDIDVKPVLYHAPLPAIRKLT